jgi:putative oxidoreductase
MKKNINIGLLVIRLSIGILMLLHGFSKLGGSLEFIEGMLSEKGLPAFFAYGVLVGEIIAPLAIVIGFRTRIAAAIFAFNCLVALALVHSQEIFTMSEHGGWAVELLGLYLFGAVALMFTGAGEISVSKSSKWD